MSSYPSVEHHDLRPAMLADYLRLRGWVEDESASRARVFYSQPDLRGRQIEAVFPRTADSPEYSRRIQDVLDMLAVLDSKSVSEVKASIFSRRSDRLEIRLSELPNSTHSLPMRSALGVLSAAQNLLAFAAMAEKQPKPWYMRRTRSGTNFIADCQFGHTQRGSFVFVLESPIRETRPEAIQQDFAGRLDLPYPRRVIERVARGFGTVQKARRSQSTDPFIEEIEVGWNSNLCSAVSRINESAPGTSVEYDISWAISWPVSADIGDSPRFKLDAQDTSLLISASMELRDEDPPKDVVIEGIVRESRLPAPSPLEATLSDEDYARQLPAGHPDAPAITIEESAPRRSIRASLTYEHWQQAGAAHLEFRRVKMSGRLIRQGNHWQLLNAKVLEVV